MSLEGKRILLIEDEPLLLMTVQDMMSDFGCQLAGSAMALSSGLQMARDLSLDLAILDVNLNGELITPAAEVLAQRGVPFLFATGYDAHIVPSLANRPRLLKPFTQKQLKDAMLRALAT